MDAEPHEPTSEELDRLKELLTNYVVFRARMRLELSEFAKKGTPIFKRIIEIDQLIKESEAREVAGHPDLQELDLQLDGYYSEDPEPPTST